MVLFQCPWDTSLRTWGISLMEPEIEIHMSARKTYYSIRLHFEIHFCRFIGWRKRCRLDIGVCSKVCNSLLCIKLTLRIPVSRFRRFHNCLLRCLVRQLWYCSICTLMVLLLLERFTNTDPAFRFFVALMSSPSPLVILSEVLSQTLLASAQMMPVVTWEVMHVNDSAFTG